MKYAIWYLTSLLKWSLVFTLGLIVSSVGIPVSLFSGKIASALLTTWSRVSLKVFGVDIIVTDANKGVYADRKIIFVSLNQNSLIELIAGNAVIPTKPLMVVNIEFALIPIIGWFVWACRSVVLIRQWHAQATNALNRAVNTLREHRTFWISIEGRRGPHGTISAYRKGPVIMAIKAGADIIPVVFKGVENVSPTGLVLVRPGKIEVELCEKLPTEAMSLEQKDRLIAQLRTVAINKLGIGKI